MEKKMEQKLSYLEFVSRMIAKRADKQYKGIIPSQKQFVVPNSNEKASMNDVFRAYYGKDVDPVAVSKDLAEKGLVVIRPFKGGWDAKNRRQMAGGVVIYLKADAPTSTPSINETLAAEMLK